MPGQCWFIYCTNKVHRQHRCKPSQAVVVKRHPSMSRLGNKQNKKTHSNCNFKETAYTREKPYVMECNIRALTLHNDVRYNFDLYSILSISVHGNLLVGMHILTSQSVSMYIEERWGVKEPLWSVVVDMSNSFKRLSAPQKHTHSHTILTKSNSNHHIITRCAGLLFSPAVSFQRPQSHLAGPPPKS